jgi:hypothetical protein
MRSGKRDRFVFAEIALEKFALRGSAHRSRSERRQRKSGAWLTLKKLSAVRRAQAQPGEER